ncbi:hypothetical protein LZD76_03340 [Lactobacillus mulieris]|uniref:hypothetical protein n=1 Tax=Lactobacillus mulieris TaxID=2508708 RepID=UPI0014332354|nr:hypothetical protein [Lactobacillus mulieris]MCF1783482.1 hypothetical protein [Lactobacillus mulieris]MCW8104543.1 hypothetical protein [Lactobacillus mulieris]MDK6803277.1 hypothetical protein [Lactobacillus mulieris]MDK8382554.1 hypothetical protein [Lactobacillus mulieris]MDT9620622.1 hypothetical protein [Lactobacillus mulieris]
MRLIDFLQVSKDLTGQTQFYLKQKSQLLPLTKLSLTSTHCFLYSGTTPLTKDKIFNIIARTKNKQIELKIIINNHEFSVYGLQIIVDKKIAILM